MRMLLVLFAAAALSASSAAQVLFQDAFESNAQGWTHDTEWQIAATLPWSTSTPQMGNPDPTFDGFHTVGGGVAGTAVGTLIQNTVHPARYLTSPPINAQGAAALTLEFDRFLNLDLAPFTTATVEVFNGTNWIVLFQNGTFIFEADAAWQRVAFDVSAHANAAFRVRFGLAVAAGAFTCGGWNIDNLVVRSGARPTAINEMFVSNANGWTLGNEWQIGAAAASSGQFTGNPDLGYDGFGTPGGGIAGIVIGGNAQTAVHGYEYLTSPAIDAAAAPVVTFAFQRHLNSDYAPYMDNTIDVFDGTNWQNLWTSGGAPGIADTGWNWQSYDLTPYKNAFLRVRFGMRVTSTAVYPVSSWNVDNVRLGAFPASATAWGAAYPLQPILQSTPPVLGTYWTLTSTGGYSGSTALLVVGPPIPAIPIQGSSSYLAVDPQLLMQVNTGSFGIFNVGAQLPASPDFLGLEIALQSVYIGPYGIYASNGLLLRFGAF